jgi:glycosyltransferase involved in cell wall biosynthesis
MRILHVYHIYPDVFGGASTVVSQITKELHKRGHMADVLTTNAYFTGKENHEEEINVYRFSLVSKLFAKRNLIIPNVNFVLWIKHMLKKYACIHIHGYRNLYTAFVYNYAKKYDVPYVLQAHGTLLNILSKQRLKRIYDTFLGYKLLRDAGKVIALNQMEVAQYRSMGVPDDKIEIVPNGIDLLEYGDLPPKGSFKEKFGIGHNEKIVLYVGRMHKSKGLDLLAHAFKFISNDVREVRLVVVGPDDGYAATFSRLISSLGIDGKVLLTGFVQQRDKLAAYVDSNVFITPNFSGFPVTFLEACLAGCPIVTASDELDWINNNVGYTTGFSSNALAKAAINLLKDEQINRKFRNNCRHTIKNFDLSTIAYQLENIYKNVVDQNF